MLADHVHESDPAMELSHEHVQRRVEDWLRRLDALFQAHRTWAKEQGWSVIDASPTPMSEELMQKYGVLPTQQPVLRLQGPDGGYAVLKPKGLWVIGSNGRVDVYTAKGAFIIVDQAEEFCDPSWRIFRSTNKREGVPYTPALLIDLV